LNSKVEVINTPPALHDLDLLTDENELFIDYHLENWGRYPISRVDFLKQNDSWR
jgi:hypothetical protein